MATVTEIASPSEAAVMASEKQATTATSTEMPPSQSPPAEAGEAKEHDHSEHGEVMGGALISLLAGAFLPCVPIALISAILLSFILYNQFPEGTIVLDQPYPIPAGELWNRTAVDLNNLKLSGGDWAYHLVSNRYTQPGTLHAIASLTGKLIPFIAGTSMALVAFFAGHRILKTTRAQKEKHMPTPHQMSILIGLLNGSGFGPLWDTIKYRYQNHETMVQPVPLAFWSLAFIVLLTLAIQAVDSWLGIAMQSLVLTVLVPQKNITYSYGRQLNTDICSAPYFQELPCPEGNSQCQYPCSITNWTTPDNLQRIGVQHAQEAAEALMSNSNPYYNTIYNTSVGGNGGQHFFLGDDQSNSSYDFLADSITVNTQCSMITQDCIVTAGQPGFTCGSFKAPSFAWTGQVGVDAQTATGIYNESGAGIQFFNDSAFNNPIGLGTTQQLFGSVNPIPFMMWSKGFPPIDVTQDQFAPMRNGGYLKEDASGDPVFILNCSMGVYQSKYNWTNGGVVGLHDVQLAPAAYGAIFSAPFAIDSALSHLSLQDAAALSAYQTNDTGLSTLFANTFSRGAVALTAGIQTKSANIFEQTRNNSQIVTRVPKVPLYLLVSLKALYALFALVLAGLAVMYADPLQAQEVKARLTIDGLAVGLFEPNAALKSGVTEMQQLYDEHTKTNPELISSGTDMDKEMEVAKVGIAQTAAGGWTWATTKKLAETLGLTDAVNIVAGDVKDNVNDDVSKLGEVGAKVTALDTVVHSTN